ncbi:unnamed protein product [Paramecium primaurelia]|uniref:Uncharacterized protein n=1 Tax=Paramecium primaurelia TaxID=5886 RepID=A0A8S1K3T3_PARPR|nr:unnamed protein product [Paramecium primaurelia]
MANQLVLSRQVSEQQIMDLQIQAITQMCNFHKMRLGTIIHSMHQKSSQFIEESLQLVEQEVQNHSYWSLTSQTIKKVNQNIENLEARLKNEINIEKNNLSYQIKLISEQIREFIQNIISIINQVTVSTTEITEKLFRILKEIEELLFRMEIVINSNRNSLTHFNISLAISVILLEVGCEWAFGKTIRNIFKGVTEIALPFIFAANANKKLQRQFYDLKCLFEQQKRLIDQNVTKSIFEMNIAMDGVIKTFLTNIKRPNLNNQRAIAWLDSHIENYGNSQLAQRIRNCFPNIQHCHFTNDHQSLINFLNENYITFLIIQGSIANETLHMLLTYPNIHSILIYCQFPEKYEDLIQKFKQIVFITNQQDEVIAALKKSLAPSLILREINLYQFPNYFQQNAALYYLSEEFSLSCIPQLSKDEALKIIKNTMQHVPNTVYTLSEEAQVELALQIHEKFKNGQIEDIINLYTGPSGFFKFINRILQSLNEKAILEASVIIQSLKYSLEKYQDNIDPNLFISSEFFLYRGVDCTIEAFKLKHKLYDLMMFPAFTSTSRDFAISKSYAKDLGIIFRISFNENNLDDFHFQNVRPKAIYTVSQFQNEQEYLFSCFSCFIITKFNEDNIIDIEFVKI